LAGSSGQDVLVSSGVSVGQTIVTAGVNLLKPGQKVTILGVEPVISQKTNPEPNKSADAGAAK
jgi:multidrug efflux system membrane fusion protein